MLPVPFITNPMIISRQIILISNKILELNRKKECKVKTLSYNIMRNSITVMCCSNFKFKLISANKTGKSVNEILNKVKLVT